MPFVLITAYASDSPVQKAPNEDAVAVLRMPMDVDQLLELFEQTCARRE